MGQIWCGTFSRDPVSVTGELGQADSEEVPISPLEVSKIPNSGEYWWPPTQPDMVTDGYDTTRAQVQQRAQR